MSFHEQDYSTKDVKRHEKFKCTTLRADKISTEYSSL